MTREETVKNLLTELIDMIDNGSQRDLDRADEIGASIIKLFKQEPKTGYISIDDAMSVFDDFMCGEDEEAETFLEMLKDKLAESEE